MRISDWSSDVCSSDPHAPGQESAQIIALEREEEDEDGEGGDDRAGHHYLIILDILAAVRGERDGQRVEVLIGEDDQRPHEIIPARQENIEQIGRASCRERVCQYV